MSRLEDIEAICQLKYRYFRALDCKLWDELADTLAEDATAAYDSGRYSFDGRDAIMKFLRDALGSPRIISMHNGHHPEIEIGAEGRARGTWYLRDTVIFRDANMILQGAGFYHDEYVKISGRWKIRSTGYERTFELMESREAPLQLRTRFDPE
ncbi:MAG TPA: nuclear transport factor 2 family protein [Candidatus Binatia bacterium]